MNSAQAEALRELRRIAAASDGSLDIVDVSENEIGTVWVDVSIDCSGYPLVPLGLPLRDRERVQIGIRRNHPYDDPAVHGWDFRFSGFDHVQWGRSFCLYQAPDLEWAPQDGMYGLMERLDTWLRMGAAGELQPRGEPLHPPVAYTGLTGRDRRAIVPRANAPVFDDRVWYGFADMQIISDRRADIVGWSELGAGGIANLRAPAILLSEPMPFEFPKRFDALVRVLGARGVNDDLVRSIIGLAVMMNGEEAPLYVVLGTLMRGTSGKSATLKQHLTVWQLDAKFAKTLVALLNARMTLSDSTDAEFKKNFEELINKVDENTKKEMLNSDVAWCTVMEARPEIVQARDKGTPMEWFKGKRVAILGCGALGTPTAECVMRAEPAKVALFDKKDVTPGVLARQMFEAADVGHYKAERLAERLRKINAGVEITVNNVDVVEVTLDQPNPFQDFDIVIDCTASRLVALKMESARMSWSGVPHIMSMRIDSTATRGLVTLAASGHSGGSHDLVRRMKLKACNDGNWKPYLDAFWPQAADSNLFQPEPGCSEPTFRGSEADLMSLAALMLNIGARDMTGLAPVTATGHFISVADGNLHRVGAQFTKDVVVRVHDDESDQDVQVRFAPGAWRELRSWIARSERTVGPESETGGILFGERDPVLRVVWVSEIDGPPPDSKASPTRFECGVLGVKESNDEKNTRTQGSVRYLGMWHTHPRGVPEPSPTDLVGFAQMMFDGDDKLPQTRQLAVIIGTGETELSVGVHLISLDEGRETKRGVAHIMNLSSAVVDVQDPDYLPAKIGLALSGGGSRAMAFHLGALRALQDLNLLDRVTVISTVSGGSVIGALYRYGNGTFADFDDKVKTTLRAGFNGAVARKLLNPLHFIPAILSFVVAGGAAAVTGILKVSLGPLLTVLGLRSKTRPDWIDRLQPPLRRWRSLTDAMVAVFTDLIGHRQLDEGAGKRPRMLINACELRTGAAFRFSDGESRCWRYGKLLDRVTVAEAVAASAAYPVMLPSLDRQYRFEKAGNEETHRVQLTDGGVDENLGVAALEPGRNPDFAYAEKLDYLICCDAGHGLHSGEELAFWWPARMIRALKVLMKGVQDGTFKRLHQYSENGLIDGFLLVYLGMQDKNLPFAPPGLVARSEVSTYPTDFSAMSAADLEKIALRAEQLTRLLSSRYLRDL